MRNVPYALSKFICWLVFRLRFGLEVTGQEHVPKTGAFLVASNHVSFLDPPLIGVACPHRLRFMARSDLFAHPVLGTYLRAVRVIPLRRGETDLGAIRAALEVLRDGEPIAIFPEGGRQLSGTLGVARRGVGVLADSAQVPIIPVLVSGSYQALPPNATRLQPSKIRVAFGPPISYTGSPLRIGTPDEERQRARERRAQLADAVTAAWRRLDAQEKGYAGP